MSESEVKRTANGQFISGHSGNPATRFKPGNNANPNGRRNSAKDILNELLDTSKKDKTRRETIMNKLLMMAEHGNLNAIKEVLDRTDGKSREYIEQRITRDEVIIE
jgi:hypothetical protein